MSQKKQPGVMLYFDLRPSLRRMTNEEKGILFESIMDYAQHGIAPDLHGSLGIAWDFIQPRLDRDAQHYQELSEQRRAAAMKRWSNKT